MAIEKLLHCKWYYSHTETENGNPPQPTNPQQITALEFFKDKDVLVQLSNNESKSNTITGTYNIATTSIGRVLAIMFVLPGQKSMVLIDTLMDEPPTIFLKLDIGYETLVFSREEK